MPEGPGKCRIHARESANHNSLSVSERRTVWEDEKAGSCGQHTTSGEKELFNCFFPLCVSHIFTSPLFVFFLRSPPTIVILPYTHTEHEPYVCPLFPHCLSLHSVVLSISTLLSLCFTIAEPPGSLICTTLCFLSCTTLCVSCRWLRPLLHACHSLTHFALFFLLLHHLVLSDMSGRWLPPLLDSSALFLGICCQVSLCCSLLSHHCILCLPSCTLSHVYFSSVTVFSVLSFFFQDITLTLFPINHTSLLSCCSSLSVCFSSLLFARVCAIVSSFLPVCLPFYISVLTTWHVYHQHYSPIIQTRLSVAVTHSLH